ncbi:MAG: transposase [Candidatus Omnitrophica bacterium]|nr:transposase [Candidatus Omnitrophota bacterium]
MILAVGDIPDQCPILIGYEQTGNGISTCLKRILVTDFWAAYDAIPGGLHQCCLFHLLNELVKVDQRNLAAEWQAFARKTKRLIQDALQLWAGADFTPEAPCIAHRAALQTFAGFGVGPLHEHRYAPPGRAAGVRLSHLHF